MWTKLEVGKGRHECRLTGKNFFLHFIKTTKYHLKFCVHLNVRIHKQYEDNLVIIDSIIDILLNSHENILKSLERR